ncbi:hypothetical protein Q9233_017183 [Columba guinea]|nr:hypothetical protein Q9233_017183 [Columba guinea]
MEMKEDVQAGRVSWRHDVDIRSWRSSWNFRNVTFYTGRQPPLLTRVAAGGTSYFMLVPFADIRRAQNGRSRENLPFPAFPKCTDDNSFLLQQKYRQICFWEKQPSGCSRISCAFQHSKPRNINGLFLPPNNNVPLQQGGQERTLHPAHLQESLRNQENISLPGHAPLIIRLNNAEDEQDDEEDDDKENVPLFLAIPNIKESLLRPEAELTFRKKPTVTKMKFMMALTLQTPEENQVTNQGVKGKMMNLLLMFLVGEQQEEKLIAILQNLADQRDGNTSAALNNAKKGGESSGRRVPAERIPGSNWRSFDNGGIHSSDPNGNYQQRRKNKDDETASAVPYVRATSRKTDSDSLEPRRSTYVFYRTVNATQEPKFGGSIETMFMFIPQTNILQDFTMHHVGGKEIHVKMHTVSLKQPFGCYGDFALQLRSLKCGLAECPYSSCKLGLLAFTESSPLKGQRGAV